VNFSNQKRLRARCAASICAFLIIGAAAFGKANAQQQAAPAHETAAVMLRIMGALAKPQEWTAEQMREQFSKEIQKVSYTSRGQKVESRCVSLYAVLKAAGAEVELKMNPGTESSKKNRPLRFAVVVVGRDGYTAVYSLAELLPEVGGRQVWLAFDANDKPFAEGEGHMRVISPEDKNPSRWVRDVGTIQIVDASK
jgi:hypothetical protein